MISRREWLRLTASGLALGTASASRLLALAPAKEATVYKDANCGCCKKWVEHMEKSGWTVTAHDVPDVGVYKKKYVNRTYVVSRSLYLFRNKKFSACALPM